MHKQRRLTFNIAGPCISDEHYMLDPLRGIGAEILDLIDDKKYFVIHAPRQSGKSTLILEIVDRINAAGEYYAVYCSLEVVDRIGDSERAIPTIIECLRFALKNFGLPDGFGADTGSIKTDTMLLWLVCEVSEIIKL